jgi:transposase
MGHLFWLSDEAWAAIEPHLGSAFCTPLSRLAGSTAAIDATYIKAHRSAHGGKGRRSSRGSQSTKIHVLTDVLGRPAVIRFTPGNVSDIRVANDLMGGRWSHSTSDRRLSPEGLSPGGHALRQARDKLLVRRRPRRHHCVLGPDPRLGQETNRAYSRSNITCSCGFELPVLN